MLDFAILGPLEGRVDGVVVPIAGFRQRALLAMLLLHPNEVVSSDRLLEELWGGEPRTDTAALRVRVSELRKTLERAGGGRPIETRAPGYVLLLTREQIDLGRFERLAADGTAALRHDPAVAAETLRAALALWRGEPLAEFAYEPFAQTAIGRLQELRLATLEKRIDAHLLLGLERELIAELRPLVADNPLREHLCGQLMLALYRAGRQAEALEVFQQKRRFLVDELGLEPGRRLQELQRAILAHDVGLGRPSPGATPGRTTWQTERTRKTVTVLVCDAALEPSTAPAPLDAEVMRRVRELAAEQSSDVFARHGASIERLFGDALVAVFGVPLAHEDDALRAVRAAVELREKLKALNVELAAEWDARLSVRFGVEAGEVLVSDPVLGASSVTGAAVQTAAQLQQAAAEGEIVVGETAWSLVRSAVSVERLATGAWRLLDIDDQAPPIPRRFDTPFFGRAEELVLLRRAYESSTRERVPFLFTVLGDAGIGKSRLAAEARLDLLAEARVLVGRCLPYGEGITYVALREIVRQALGDRPLEALPSLLAPEPDGARVADAVGALLGLVPANVPLEEGFWGVSRLCEALARPRPLVLVFEDVHWAEASMLDLIEYIVANAVDSPLLVLCLARHELLEHRPGWSDSKPRAATVELDPLTQREAELLATWLIRDRGAAGSTADIVETAQGNPLFVEQLVAMLADSGWTPGERRLPATVEALLASRLELLGPAARIVLERASVLGDRFEAAALARVVTADLRTNLPSHLRALVAKDLLGSARSPGGDDAYRFRHVLVQEAAYRRLPKAQRADVHEQFADDLASTVVVVGAGGRDELIGYHFERAYAYRLQLGREDPRTKHLAERATEHLVAAAAEAFARTDFRAVDQLLDRAAPLMANDDPRRAPALYDRGTSLLTLGRPEEADAVLREAIEAALLTGDRRSEWRARLDRAVFWGNRTAGAASALERWRLARAGVRELGVLGDDRGLVRAWRLGASIARDRGRAARMEQAGERMLVHARRSGVYREEAWAAWVLAEAILIGPTPVEVGIGTCERLMLGSGELRVGDIGPLATVALLRAMQGEFEQGRELLARGRRLLDALGHKRPLMTILRSRGELELLAGEWGAAENVLRSVSELAAAAGDGETVGEVSALRARTLTALGQLEEAERLVRTARECAASQSRRAQAIWRSTAARVLADRGAADAAVELGSQAVRLLRRTDLVSLRADAYVDLATALRTRGDGEEAAAAVERARLLYELKGNTVAARRLREAATVGMAGTWSGSAEPGSSGS